jgi:hypothetical protein
MRRCLAGATAAAVLSLVGTAAVAAHAGTWRWSLQKVMQRLDGTRVRVESRLVRIDSETMLCSGVGGSARVNGTRAWKHFDCTYSVFVLGHGIYDCEFRVHVLGPRRYLVSNAHWPSGGP